MLKVSAVPHFKLLMLFKGGYERGAGIYKHIYFNVTIQTFLIWSSTIVSVIALYESIKYLIGLAFKSQVTKLGACIICWWTYGC